MTTLGASWIPVGHKRRSIHRSTDRPLSHGPSIEPFSLQGIGRSSGAQSGGVGQEGNFFKLLRNWLWILQGTKKHDDFLTALSHSFCDPSHNYQNIIQSTFSPTKTRALTAFQETPMTLPHSPLSFGKKKTVKPRRLQRVGAEPFGGSWGGLLDGLRRVARV